MIRKVKEIIFDISLMKFIIVGGCCTLIDFIIYIFLDDYTGTVLAKLISMCCSIVVNYFLNKFWSFSAKNIEKAEGAADNKEKAGRTAAELRKYVVAQAINIITNVSVNTVILKLSGIKILSFVIATGSAMVVNYLLQRFWVFEYEGERS